MKAQRTADRGPPGGGHDGATLAVHTVHQIGNTRSLLPNGNLLCRDVPIARSGWLLYGPGEVPVKAGSNGIVYIERTNDQLFNPTTVASFQGAAVTNDHPMDDVTPLTWNGTAGGFALNVRQGTGDDADVLLADLMITNKKCIDAIQAGKVEVSAGYDADYEDLGNGMGRQSNIIGNHIALVEKGRCGPRCAIGDQAYFFPPPPTKETPMATRTPLRGKPRVKLVDDEAVSAARQRFTDAQAELEALESGEDDAGDGAQHIHIHMGGTTDAAGEGTKTVDKATEDRFTKIEATLDQFGKGLETITTLLGGKTGDGDMGGKGKKKDDEDEDDDEKMPKGKKKTGDSAALETGYVELKALTEILVPGYKTPTFDADMTRASTVDRMCNVRRAVLDRFSQTEGGETILMAANGGKTVDLASMDCAEAAVLFKTAATAKGAVNNALATRDSLAMAGANGVTQEIKGLPSPAQMNAAASEFWKGK